MSDDWLFCCHLKEKKSYKIFDRPLNFTSKVHDQRYRVGGQWYDTDIPILVAYFRFAKWLSLIIEDFKFFLPGVYIFCSLLAKSYKIAWLNQPKCIKTLYILANQIGENSHGYTNFCGSAIRLFESTNNIFDRPSCTYQVCLFT